MQKKQANLAENSDISAVSQYANKNKQKIEKLQTFYLIYFLRIIFLMIMAFKIYLFINQDLIHHS